MLKIGKGLKKKKKSKKHKKEEELFKPEELEQYRREHQQREAEAAELAEQHAEEASTTKVAPDNDEWKKFNALTSGIDSVLKKTQTDLDRIKSTSFFKKVPPPKPTPPPKPEPPKQDEHQHDQGEKSGVNEQLPQFFEVESESEYEEEEDIFDTSYVDVVASGEVKLAYVPDSPTEEETQDDFDPFDTSAADKIIRGPEVSKKGKRIVSIGSAVEVLTGRIESVSTCAIGKKAPRRVQENTDLLLDPEVDSNGNLTELSTSTPVVEETTKKSLLDDDDPPPIDEPIDLSVSLIQKKLEAVKGEKTPEEVNPALDLKEFDVLTSQNGTDEPDEFDDEFASLAAESLKSVKPQGNPEQIKTQVQPTEVEAKWDAFGDETNLLQSERKLSSVSIHITDPSGFSEALNNEHEKSHLEVTQKDLLGGSTSDLSALGESIAPTEVEEELLYKDPFDTSVVDQINIPGKTELKFIEEELLGNTKTELKHSLSDPDFDPRKDEEVVVQQPIAENFDLSEEEGDPFDTSFIATVVPGKAELKLIESELAQLENQVSSPPSKLQEILSNPEKLSKAVSPPKDLPLPKEKETTDLLFVEDNVDIKALTPAVEKPVTSEFDISYSDPFDTSATGNILPGKAELKLLENELLTIQTPVTVKPAKETIEKVLPTAFTPPVQPVQKKEIDDLLSDIPDNTFELKALTPEKERSPTEADDYDPFDTSITTNLVPGKVELKLLESELIQ